ncbi:MAG: DUF4157 domain-containing protein [Chloroflexales bacterium]|nr:DUF4157 domain-containing protein [Chloroflexales bacterium]
MMKTKIQTKQQQKTLSPTVIQEKRGQLKTTAVTPNISRMATEGSKLNTTARVQAAKVMQRQVGNTRLSRMLGTTIQPKLTVGRAGDKYEQEADQVARQVTAPTAPELEEEEQTRMKPAIQRLEEDEEEKAQIQLASPTTGMEDEEAVQPQAAVSTTETTEDDEQIMSQSDTRPGMEEKDEGAIVQRQAAPQPVAPEEEDKQPIQMKAQAGSTGGEVGPTMESDIRQAQRGGQPLPEDVQTSMGQKFGADFSGVKIHRDKRADMLNRSLNSRAFTTGQNIFFKRGEYNPGTSGGRELLAHELTHVVQQRGNLQKAGPAPLQRKILLKEPTPLGVSWRKLSRRRRRKLVRKLLRKTLSRRDYRLAKLVARDMAYAKDEFKFDTIQELKIELIKRVATSRQMQESQRTVRKKHGFGYPFTGSSLYWGPRVNFAAREYWTPKVVDDYSPRKDKTKRAIIRNSPRNQRHTVYGDPGKSYRWTLSSTKSMRHTLATLVARFNGLVKEILADRYDQQNSCIFTS